MDLNLAVLSGRVSAEPEVTTFASGATLARVLVTVRSGGEAGTDERRRIDVIPTVLWNPDDETIDTLYEARGKSIWVPGRIQRRFWSADIGRTSRIELVANDYVIRG